MFQQFSSKKTAATSELRERSQWLIMSLTHTRGVESRPARTRHEMTSDHQAVEIDADKKRHEIIVIIVVVVNRHDTIQRDSTWSCLDRAKQPQKELRKKVRTLT